ncbi:hypothetical protein IJ847_02335 [Candidatus Saccharibacteria bacterium]|nr:hypothetical protein [Candidatus Saccharibacteria bacterium]
MELFSAIMLSLIFIETTAIGVKTFAPSKLKIGKTARRKLFIDTSVLMDGRILSVAKAGFLGDELYIPRSVIRELQLLADGSDAEKRARARFGLDVANELTHLESCLAEIFSDESGGCIKVDERLLDLAKQHSGIILTNDFNLIKVAATEKIAAISINDLAQGLRSEYLPGDRLFVKIVGTGSNAHQGVAYLPDGTMVVVDDAERLANTGKSVEIEFVRYLQTNAGRMMFAKLCEKKGRSKAATAEQKIAQQTKSAANSARTSGRKNRQSKTNVKAQSQATTSNPKRRSHKQ